MAVTYPMQFRERLKAIMEERGMTQETLRRELHVRQATVPGWVTGKNEPRLHSFVEMCILFGVTADWLLGMDKVL